MSDPSRLLRPFDDGDLAVPAGPVVWLRAEASGFLDLFDPGQLTAEQSFRPAHDRLSMRGIAPVAEATGRYSMAVASITRDRVESRGLIARAWALAEPSAKVIINGDKTEGIDALIREIKAHLAFDGVTAKSHGKIAWLTRTEATPALFDTWAEAARPRQNSAGYLTGPGMFSADGPDAGSERLAAHFGPKIKGRAADFGAGWGWLSAALLKASPEIAAIDLYEAERAALTAAEANITDPRASFIWADIPQTPVRDPYDLIIMNPPFHAGRRADPGLGISFVAAAQRFLKPNGQLLMVANRHLPYEPALEAGFRRVEKRAEDAQFKIYLAAKPRR